MKKEAIEKAYKLAKDQYAGLGVDTDQVLADLAEIVISLHCWQTDDVGGFEKDRNTLKKLCPAKQYGLECKYMEKCPVKQGIRIKIEEDRRIFTSIDRASYKWDTRYDKRTSAERVNSRLGESFGFKKHYIRGKTKMTIRCGIALCVMLAMAVGRIKENQADKMRSLVG